MGKARTIAKALAGVAAGLGVLLAQPTLAQALAPEPGASRTVSAPLDSATPLQVHGDVERIVVSQPDTAKVGVAGPNSLYVMGREPGATNLLVYGPRARLLEVIDVRVGPDAARLEADIRDAFPDEAITVLALNTGVLLRGEVSSPSAAAAIEALAERVAPGEVTSLLHARAGQVRLEVQLVEASADDLRDLGVDLDASAPNLRVQSGDGLIGLEPPQGVVRLTGGAGRLNLDVGLSALERRGAAKVLARPELVAMSGETASFRSGGEFPFPVPQRQGEITVEFRSYGTALVFQPQIQANGFIRLALASEVSSLDPRNSLRMGGVTIPALNVRRMATTLDLRDGETFYFAGLYQSDEEQRTSQTPRLGDLPVLGALFRSERVRRQRLELAVIVTAHIDGSPAARGSPAEQMAKRPLLAEAPAAEARKPRRSSFLKTSPVTRPLRLLAEAADTARRWGWRRLQALARLALGPPQGPAPPATVRA